jgi:hypothetical protein
MTLKRIPVSEAQMEYGEYKISYQEAIYVTGYKFKAVSE